MSLTRINAVRGRSVDDSLLSNVQLSLTYALAIGGYSPNSQFFKSMIAAVIVYVQRTPDELKQTGLAVRKKNYLFSFR